jgi:hypothetical protein
MDMGVERYFPWMELVFQGDNQFSKWRQSENLPKNSRLSSSRFLLILLIFFIFVINILYISFVSSILIFSKVEGVGVNV